MPFYRNNQVAMCVIEREKNVLGLIQFLILMITMQCCYAGGLRTSSPTSRLDIGSFDCEERTPLKGLSGSNVDC